MTVFNVRKVGNTIFVRPDTPVGKGFAAKFKELYSSASYDVTVGINDEYANFNTADYATDATDNAPTKALKAAIIESRARGLNRVKLRPSTAPYEFSGLNEPELDGIIIEGFNMDDCIVKSPDGASDPVFRIGGSVGADRVGFWNMTVDGNNVNQDYDSGNSATWFSPIQMGRTDNVSYKNLRVKNAVKHAILLTGGTGADLTGTADFTRGSRVITGSGTSFLSEISVGDYIRSAVTGFVTMPVRKVNSDTELILTYPWQHDSETGATLKFGLPCDSPLFDNVELDGNLYDDLLGGGLWQYGTFHNLVLKNGAGYLLGNTQIIYCNISSIYAEGGQQGLGLERAVASNFGNIVTKNNRDNGVFMINGCFDVNIENLITEGNGASGLSEGLTVVGGKRKMHNIGVTINNIQSSFNGEHGVRCASSVGTKILNGNIKNNGQSGGTWYGLALTGDSTESLKQFYASSLTITDTQATKTQSYGVLVGTHTEKKTVSLINNDLSGNASGEIVIQ